MGVGGWHGVCWLASQTGSCFIVHRELVLNLQGQAPWFTPSGGVLELSHSVPALV